MPKRMANLCVQMKTAHLISIFSSLLVSKWTLSISSSAQEVKNALNLELKIPLIFLRVLPHAYVFLNVTRFKSCVFEYFSQGNMLYILPCAYSLSIWLWRFILIDGSFSYPDSRNLLLNALLFLNILVHISYYTWEFHEDVCLGMKPPDCNGCVNSYSKRWRIKAYELLFSPLKVLPIWRM